MIAREEMLRKLQEHARARAAAQGWRGRNGKLTKTGNRAALEFIMGAAAAMDAVGLNETHGLTGIAFVAAVRDAEDFLKEPEA